MKVVYQDSGFRSTMRSRVKTEGVDVIKHPRNPNVGQILSLKFINVTLVYHWLLDLFHFSIVA